MAGYTHKVYLYDGSSNLTDSHLVNPNQWNLPYIDTLTGKFYEYYKYGTSVQEFTQCYRVPSKSGYRFTGARQRNLDNAGALRIDSNGDIIPGITSSAYYSTNIPIYIDCEWIPWSYAFTLDYGGVLYKPSVGVGVYADSNCTTATSSVTIPFRAGYRFGGYFTAANGGGTMYINASGVITSAFADFTASAAVTLYAYWIAAVVITIDNAGGSGGMSTVYYIGGQFYSDAALTNLITALAIPTKSSSVLLGFFDAASGGNKILNADGVFGSWEPASNRTIFAQWKDLTIVSVDANGGTGGTTVFYYDSASGRFFSDVNYTNQITQITVPAKSGSRLLGLFVNSIMAVAPNGVILDSFVPSASCAIVAMWKTVRQLTLNAGAGSGGDAYLLYDADNGKYYDGRGNELAVGSMIVRPQRECYRFGGFSLQSTLFVDSNGACLAALFAYVPTADVELNASWVRCSWKLTISADGATGGTPAIYVRDPNSGETIASAWYADDQLASTIATIVKPNKIGYDFAGAAVSDVTVITSGGIIVAEAENYENADYTAVSSWTVHVYTLTLDPSGGTVSPSSVSCRVGQIIGSLPTPIRGREEFLYWRLNGNIITSQSIWNLGTDATALAVFKSKIGNVVDYFGLASAEMIPIDSNSGDGRNRIYVSHTGRRESGVGARSGIWRNPTVVYRIVGNISNRPIVLGHAFPATYNGNDMTISGYMISLIKVDTSIGEFPTVTISAVANEGVDAINLFTFNLNVSANAHAQVLASAFEGGGAVQQCTLEAKADPVVIDNNMMPIASDVVNGRVVVTGHTFAINEESDPIGANGFVQLGQPEHRGDVTVKTWSINLEKDII